MQYREKPAVKQGVTSFSVVLMATLILLLSHYTVSGQSGKDAVLTIKKTDDFSLDGAGKAKNWSGAEWVDISLIPSAGEKPQGLTTKAKVLYSNTGMYFLFRCEDRVLNATLDADFTRLWTEDVVEVFLWPDEREVTYFEYEISPLNYELILHITRDDRGSSSWQPFSYGGDRQTRHMTSVEGGEKKSGASITSWTAEFFIPYRLLHPARNIPPEPGTRWRANMYRIDYDEGQSLLAWQPINKSYHEYEKFGTFIFE